MGFQQQSVWIKSSFALITIGFVVWLAAGDQGLSARFRTSEASYNALIAFLIIGIIAYYGAVLLNFLLIFVPDTEGNPIVLIVGAALGILAGISGMIVSGIGNSVPFSDRIAWALICAIISAAFLLVSFICGGGRGIPKHSANAPAADFQQPHLEVPA